MNKINLVDALEPLDLPQAGRLVGSLKATLQEDVGDLKSLLLLGHSHYLLGELAEAIAIFKKIIALHPETPQAYYHLGVALYRSARVTEALQALAKVTELAPSMVMAYYWMGVAYYHQGQYEEARQAFEILLEQNAESTIAHYHAALACMALRAHDRARQHLEALLAKGQKDPQVYLFLGQTLLRLNQPSAAMDTYRRGLELNPGNAPLKDALAYLTDVEDP